MNDTLNKSTWRIEFPLLFQELAFFRLSFSSIVSKLYVYNTLSRILSLKSRVANQ